jgi:hypothetical protein
MEGGRLLVPLCVPSCVLLPLHFHLPVQYPMSRPKATHANPRTTLEMTKAATTTTTTQKIHSVRSIVVLLPRWGARNPPFPDDETVTSPACLPDREGRG